MANDKDKIISELNNLLPAINSTKYNYHIFNKLKLLTKLIKKYAIKNTKVNKDIKRIYRKFSPGIHFVTVYASTQDFKKALNAYKMIELWGGYIQFEDLYYEHPTNKEYIILANKFKNETLNKLNKDVKKELIYADKVLQSYWKLEMKYKTLMKSKYEFTDREIEDFIFLKAKSIICYPIILKQFCHIPQGLVDVINYNQAIYDFYDDYWDLKEDLDDLAPNSFILALLKSTDIKDLKKLPRKELINLSEKKVVGRLREIARKFKEKGGVIPLPHEYMFWHHLITYNFEFLQYKL